MTSTLLYVGGKSPGANVYALDLVTGNSVWKFAMRSSILESPATTGGVVYIPAVNDRLYAFDAKSGEVIWTTHDLTDGESGGFVTTPAVQGRTLYVGAGSHVYALHTEDGSERWKASLEGQVEAPVTVSNGTVYATTDDGLLYSLKGETGKTGWTFRSLRGSGWFISSPAVWEDQVIVHSFARFIYAVDRDNGQLQWKYETGGGRSSPAVADDVVFVGSGHVRGGSGKFFALNVKTGALLWEFTPDDQPRAIVTTPALSGGTAYFGAENGYLFALNTSTGALRWTYETGGPIRSSPAVAAGVVYVGSEDGNLYALDAETGEGPSNWMNIHRPRNVPLPLHLLMAIPMLLVAERFRTMVRGF